MRIIILISATIVFSIISLLILIYDTKKHEGDTERSFKFGKLYYIYCITMILITLLEATILAVYYKDLSVVNALTLIGLLSILWPVALIDFKTFRIPNIYIIYGMVIWVIQIVVEYCLNFKLGNIYLISQLVAAAALFLATLLCSLVVKNSIGFGDIKLFIVMGLLLGLEGIWGPVFCSLIVSFVLAIVLLITKRKKRKDMIPFAPAIMIGTFLSIFLMGV